MAAFAHAIRSHRRLIKLAPRQFDFAVVDRASAARRAEIARRQKWLPILDRVYGTTTPPSGEAKDSDDLDPPSPQSPQTCRAIERELDDWNRWIDAGHEALALFAQRQPHARMSLSHIARLAGLGFTFGRLATGLETSPPEPELPPQGYLLVDQALEKIYGDPVQGEEVAGKPPTMEAKEAW